MIFFVWFSALLGGQVVPYNLLEDGGWSMDVGGLEGIISDAKAKGIEVRGIVLINPGKFEELS
jgi:aspartate/methionine/tyrosine aminotransferase